MATPPNELSFLMAAPPTPPVSSMGEEDVSLGLRHSSIGSMSSLNYLSHLSSPSPSEEAESIYSASSETVPSA